MERWTFAKTLGAIVIAAIIVYGFGCGEDECVDELFTPEAMALKTVLVGCVFLFYALDNSRKIAGNESVVYRIDRCPMAKIKDLTPDVPASISGKVGAEASLVSPYSKRECVYYHSITERYEGSGDSAQWVVKENISEYAPFWISDGSGRVLVDLRSMYDDLSGFKIEKLRGISIVGAESDREIPLFRSPSQKYSEIDCMKMMERKHLNVGTRRTEYVLSPGTEVFAYGMASRTKHGLAIHSTHAEPLIISKRTKEQYVEDFFGGRANRAIYWSSFLIATGLIAVYAGLNVFVNLPLIILLFAVLAVFFFLLIRIHNRIVLLLQRAKDSMSQIDIQLKRRYDLIPAMNALVKEYGKYEKGVLADLARIRLMMLTPFNASEGAETFSKENLELKRLIAISERYPNLRASEGFRRMMEVLADTEERISYSRSFFNRTVLKYNTIIATVPGNLFALLFGFRRMQYFSESEK